MHTGRVKLRGLVDQRRVVVAPRFRDGHKIGDAVQRGVFARCGHLDGQGAGQVDLTRRHGGAGACEGGQAFARHERAVDLGRAVADHAIDGHPAAGPDQNDIAHGQFCHAHGFR